MSITVYTKGEMVRERNFSNANFFRVTKALGLENVCNEYCGSVEGYQLQWMLDTVLHNAARAVKAYDTFHEMAYMTEAIEDLLDVLMTANASGQEVVWA